MREQHSQLVGIYLIVVKTVEKLVHEAVKEYLGQSAMAKEKTMQTAIIVALGIIAVILVIWIAYDIGKRGGFSYKDGLAVLGIVVAILGIIVVWPNQSSTQTGKQEPPGQSRDVSATPTDRRTKVPASCNWAKDWQLQADGSYLWVGLPPGTSICQNVGQAGELLQRMASGEELTLVVMVGSTPLGLDICSGSYEADSFTPGKLCASRESPAVWPKVTGKLVVRNSTGFLVGTGK